MEILPSEYQHLELTRSEKVFIRNILANDRFGYLLLNVNPAMLPNEKMHIFLTTEGVIIFKFFSGLEDANQFSVVMPLLINTVYQQTCLIIAQKLKTNKALIDDEGKLKIPVTVVYVFSELVRDALTLNTADIETFSKTRCLFKDDLRSFRSSLKNIVEMCLANPMTDVSTTIMPLDENNVNSIIQRLAPEYVTIRVSNIIPTNSTAGVDNELLVISENDTAVKAYRLDEEQINIVNKMSKGDQLILACAGSGKSVLLIAKCFKAAEMNPEKQFLITCYNKNLYSLYTWFIDQAGLKAKNVTCMTFHTLCKTLLQQNGYSVHHSDFDGWVSSAISKLNSGKISQRYYGIFIDEVQEFNTEWYKFCFNLLENKNTDDHIFVICGDKTQKIKSQQKQGKAPWNAGEGYPNYRGGNKNIRIERNYRNCIEINEYINRYVSYAKNYLKQIDQRAEIDPDMFLRGKSVSHGYGVSLKKLSIQSNQEEARRVYESIGYIHDTLGIPYDEIAVIMYNGSYRKKIANWSNKKYNLENPLMSLLAEKDIPFCQMYDTDSEWGARYGEDGGVRLIKVASVLGLDFRAAIVCGLMPLGDYNKTKDPDWNVIKKDEELYEQTIKSIQNDIRYLYVACTRAKEVLHIILPESGRESIYMKMLENSAKEGGVG